MSIERKEAAELRRITSVSVATSAVTNEARERHTGEDFLAFLRLLGRTNPAGEVYVILENVRTRKSPALRR